MAVVLVGTDFSTRSDRALRRGILLARQLGHQLHIVAVIEDERSPVVGCEQEERSLPLLRRMQRTITEEDGVHCSVEVRTGYPHEELAEAAQQCDATVMVIGPHRRSLLKDAFGAITAERIVSKSSVPVLAANSVPADSYRRLLLPVEFSEQSLRTAREVGSFPLAARTETALLHVYNPEARGMLGRALISAEERRAYLSECAAAAQAKLRDFAASAGMEQAALLVKEASGPVAEEISTVAAEDKAEPVVLARTNKGIIERSILRSVTSELLRAADRDVLVFPSLPGHADRIAGARVLKSSLPAAKADQGGTCPPSVFRICGGDAGVPFDTVAVQRGPGQEDEGDGRRECDEQPD